MLRCCREGPRSSPMSAGAEAFESVGGLDPEVEIQKYLTGVPERSKDAWARPELQAVLIDIDEWGKATHIEIIRKQCENPEHEGNSNGS